ncbi:MAG: hypothetical protein J3K34DRAFT_525143 [Monoraphidium minutum]|nr:MAG: hypothetical protein J3K34DRAFT_525143 [Monoraphidium minutum]
MRWTRAQRAEAEALDVTLFEQPLALARQPVPGPSGPELRFKNERERAQFHFSCSRQVAANCRRGARAGCAVKAARECRGPAWLRWLGINTGRPWQEQDACEAAAMERCLDAADAACDAHGAAFCTLVTERDAAR